MDAVEIAHRTTAPWGWRPGVVSRITVKPDVISGFFGSVERARDRDAAAPMKSSGPDGAKRVIPVSRRAVNGLFNG
jgi:hypothetical protein